MNVKRITRLVKLLQVLLDGKGHNAASLATTCGVSRRTVFRDLEALRQAGVPLKFDSERDLYSIASTFFLPPTNFTAAEALALIALASEVGREGGVPFYEAARSAALKLENTLPPALREQMQLMTRAIHIRIGSTGKSHGHRHIYQQLVDSHASRRVVRIQYHSLTEWEKISTKLRPFRLVFNSHSWYVIGRSSLHKEVRTFKLTRIDELEMLDEKFTIPKSFRLRNYLGNAWRIIPSEEPDHHVHLHFQPLVAQNVAEILWHGTQETEFREDGSLDFRAQVSGLSEIIWWILGYGDQVEVLAPQKLREMVATRAKNLAAMYNG